MMKHGMDLVASITSFLNAGQIPVLCVDQPLFATAKLIQWNTPEKYSEKQFVVMFGPFHIEQSFLRLIGQVLNGSGWVGVISNSGVISESSCEAILKVGCLSSSIASIFQSLL